MKYKSKPVEEVELPIPTEDYFSALAVKTGVWQYLIDHAQVIDKDLMRVNFPITTQEDFWWRVKCRQEGTYRRKEIFDHDRKLESRAAKIKQLIKTHEDSVAHNRKIVKIREEGTAYQKLLLILARTLKNMSMKLVKTAIT